jgi:asparagine synthase (glutamine-hydrolysing)
MKENKNISIKIYKKNPFIKDVYNYDNVSITIEYDHYLKKISYQNRNVHFFYVGEFFKPTNLEKDIALEYFTKGSSFIKNIDGVFSLIIIDLEKKKTYLFTDRLNSYKIYFYETGNTIYFSNTLFSFPDRKYSINISSLSAYLMNGNILNNNTLFNEIKSLKRAFVYELSDGIVKSYRYWDINFNYEYTNQSLPKLKEELKHLLVNSILKRYSNNQDIYFSLSGGVDISLIFGLLHQYTDNKNIHAFSYYYKDIKRNSDTYIAQKQSEFYSSNIQLVNSFNGNFKNTIVNNAMWGMCQANISEEIDCWVTLKETIKDNTILFTGEEFFGWKKQITESRLSGLHQIGLKSSSSLKKLKQFLPSTFYDSLIEAYNSQIKTLINTRPDITDLYDYKNYIYFDQNLSNTLINWRSYFSSRIFETKMPLLDYEIIDFITKLPKEYRYNKNLFRTVAKEMLPDLFKIPRAKMSNSNPKWKNIIKNSSKDIHELINTKSDLNEYIDPAVIKKIISSDKLNIQYLLKKPKKILRKILHNLPINVDYTEPVLWDTLCKRILVIREFLTQITQKQNE